MPLLRRRQPAPSTEDVAKAVVAELTKSGIMGALPSGANTSSAVEQVAHLLAENGQATPGGVKAYFEQMPWTDPNVAFGPGKPIGPAAIDPLLPQTGRTPPRTYEYPVAVNLQLGQTRHLPFQILRKGAEVDIVRRCIEIRKSDIIALEWDITLSDQAIRRTMLATGERNRAKAAQSMASVVEPQIEALKAFWEKPDRMNNLTFSQWLNAALEEVLVTDALTVYPHPSLGRSPVPGLMTDTHSLRIIDGTTIKPLLDHLGNIPQAPQPAYQQVMYGFPRGEYTYDPDARGELMTDQITYRPRNRRVNSPYGLPPVEQALALIDLWLKREEWLRAEYGVGTNPNTWLKTMNGAETAQWTPQQRRDYEQAMNADLSGQTDERHMLKILPPGLEPAEMAEFAEKYKSDYDDMLALRVASYFDVMGTQLNITPKSGLGGAGHQEGESDKSESQARRPTVQFLVDLLNDLSRSYLGASDDLTFKFSSTDDDDLLEVAQAHQFEVFSGFKTLNDLMAEIGRPLYTFPEADMPFIAGRGVPMTFLEGSSTRPEAGPGNPAPEDPDGLTDKPGAELSTTQLVHGSPSDKPTAPAGAPGTAKPSAATANLNDDAVGKAAEAAAYRKFIAKGPRSREFVWAHHDPDEAKAVMADLGKALAPEWPGRKFDEAIVQHYAGPLGEAIAKSLTGVDETVRRYAVHAPALVKSASPEDIAAAQQAIQTGVTVDPAQIIDVLQQVYGDSYLTGSQAAVEATEGAGGTATIESSVADLAANVDWSTWKPGWDAAATKDASGGLRTMLDQAEITVKGITDTNLDRIGEALAQALARGDSVDTITQAIGDMVGGENDQRAEMIARTEVSRAMGQATADTYRQNGIAEVDLLVMDPCPICEAIADDNPHPIADVAEIAPPRHPNCRCALGPVIHTGGD